ncbi:hypothetical protein V6Z12_A02G169400 [Gossypium hirsutum]
MSEQLKERQEQEKRLQKVAKTMNHMERAKREEAAPLIEAAFQRRLLEEKVLHEREQQMFYLHLHFHILKGRAAFICRSLSS